jgi:hypothetical protein
MSNDKRRNKGKPFILPNGFEGVFVEVKSREAL